MYLVGRVTQLSRRQARFPERFATHELASGRQRHREADDLVGELGLGIISAPFAVSAFILLREGRLVVCMDHSAKPSAERQSVRNRPVQTRDRVACGPGNKAFPAARSALLRLRSQLFEQLLNL